MRVKTVIQGLILVMCFIGVWLGFSQLDFVSFFKIDQRTSTLENKLGDLIWSEISNTDRVVVDDSIIRELDKLIQPICVANSINRDSLKIHIIQKNDVNAFALPNKHLVVYTGLILNCRDQESLQGVIGHEIAHLERNHVIKKLSKEIGFSVLLSATTGVKKGEIGRQIFKTLSSSAYDRLMEKEADIASVDYLIKAGINPKPYADFMFNMSQEDSISDKLYWISSHPESEERAKYIMEYIKSKAFKSKSTVSVKDWEAFQQKVKSYDL